MKYIIYLLVCFAELFIMGALGISNLKEDSSVLLWAFFTIYLAICGIVNFFILDEIQKRK